MSRKKTAKRTAKRQPTSSTFTAMQKMEKDFLNAPAELSAEINKKIKTLKAQEGKLKNTLAKIKLQHKKNEARIKAIKSKNTPTAKKQLAKFKKAHVSLTKDHTDLLKKLHEHSQIVTLATAKSSKLAALRKHLAQFEKEWSKKAKTLKTTAKPKTTRKKRVSNTQKAAPITSSPQEPSQTDTYESILNERIEETAETTS